MKNDIDKYINNIKFKFKFKFNISINLQFNKI